MIAAPVELVAGAGSTRAGDPVDALAGASGGCAATGPRGSSVERERVGSATVRGVPFGRERTAWHRLAAMRAAMSTCPGDRRRGRRSGWRGATRRRCETATCRSWRWWRWPPPSSRVAPAATARRPLLLGRRGRLRGARRPDPARHQPPPRGCRARRSGEARRRPRARGTALDVAAASPGWTRPCCAGRATSRGARRSGLAVVGPQRQRDEDHQQPGHPDRGPAR